MLRDRREAMGCGGVPEPLLRARSPRGRKPSRIAGVRRLLSFPLAIVLAVAIHVDWHVARPHHHRLSLDWDYHWLLGVAVFAAAAAYVVYRWPGELWEASAVNLVAGVVGGILAIPAGTGLYYEHRLVAPTAAEWDAFTQFATAGLLTYLVTVPLTIRCSSWLRTRLASRAHPDVARPSDRVTA